MTEHRSIKQTETWMSRRDRAVGRRRERKAKAWRKLGRDRQS